MGTLHRDVSTVAHRDSDIRCHQCGCPVQREVSAHPSHPFSPQVLSMKSQSIPVCDARCCRDGLADPTSQTARQHEQRNQSGSPDSSGYSRNHSTTFSPRTMLNEGRCGDNP